jgi:hypothetical protein
MDTSIDTNWFQRRRGGMSKLAGLIFVALLLPAIPASAASFDSGQQVTIPGSADADANTWPVGSASRWNASINRAVNRLVNPFENVSIRTTQIEDHLSGSSVGTHQPDKTLVGFELVIH